MINLCNVILSPLLTSPFIHFSFTFITISYKFRIKGLILKEEFSSSKDCLGPNILAMKQAIGGTYSWLIVSYMGCPSTVRNISMIFVVATNAIGWKL